MIDPATAFEDAGMQARAGIGLRQPHYAQVLNDKPVLGFVEVHSENFFADGGAALAVLQSARITVTVRSGTVTDRAGDRGTGPRAPRGLRREPVRLMAS